MMDLAFLVFGSIAALCIIAIMALGIVQHLTNPERRIQTGRVLSALHDESGVTHSCLAPDAKCGTCGRGNVNTLVRNRWQEDMPVCQGCLAYYNDTAPSAPVIPMTRTQARRSLDAPDHVGKPLPRF